MGRAWKSQQHGLLESFRLIPTAFLVNLFLPCFKTFIMEFPEKTTYQFTVIFFRRRTDFLREVSCYAKNTSLKTRPSLSLAINLDTEHAVAFVCCRYH